MLRRIVRRFLPRREHPLLDRVERIPSDDALEGRYRAAVVSDSSDSFIAARYYEGTRWRYFLRRDPHFGIPLLTLWPAPVQRRIAAARGFDQPHHYVNRIYSSVTQIARTLFPLQIVAVLSRSRMPSRWFWDAIFLRNLK